VFTLYESLWQVLNCPNYLTVGGFAIEHSCFHITQIYYTKTILYIHQFINNSIQRHPTTCILNCCSKWEKLIMHSSIASPFWPSYGMTKFCLLSKIINQSGTYPHKAHLDKIRTWFWPIDNFSGLSGQGCQVDLF